MESNYERAHPSSGRLRERARACGYVVNAAGNMWQYDRLEWTGQKEYAANKWQPLEEDLAVSGTWKGVRSGRLAFVAINDAGHFLPPMLERALTENYKSGWLGIGKCEAPSDFPSSSLFVAGNAVSNRYPPWRWCLAKDGGLASSHGEEVGGSEGLSELRRG